MTRRTITVFAALGVAGVLAAVIAIVSAGRPSLSGGSLSGDNFDMRSARAFRDFELYFLGSEFRGLPLTAILRNPGTYESPAPGRMNNVSFIYGDCTPTSDTGCAPPLTVQVWPACERNLSRYQLVPDPDGPEGPAAGQPYPHDPLTLRGVPGALFDGETRLELYTGAVTVALFGADSEQLRAAAQALRGVNSAPKCC